ncbi:hypothetical protein RIR_jg29453.t1 [Rhizophagus irregularis DAOM 181602=DAOM 197198]|nr:hypothetical protein RIR_jg29453.t1 [Rhizophagus irregularis DAOM 181602=DAOM 197198]
MSGENFSEIKKFRTYSIITKVLAMRYLLLNFFCVIADFCCAIACDEIHRQKNRLTSVAGHVWEIIGDLFIRKKD